MIWQVGRKLHNNKYMLVDVLGMDAYIVTYKALDIKANSPVIIKAFQGDFKNEEKYKKALDLFMEKTRILLNCQSNNLANFRDIFNEDECICAVIQFVEGITLQQLVNQRIYLEENLALQYICRVSLALANVFHANQLVHGDINPSNIVIQSNNNVVLLPTMGLETSLGLNAMTAEIIGSNYKPIEQYQRKSKRDRTEDLYGLASTLYFSLSGKEPPSAIDRMMNQESLLPLQNNSEAVITGVLKGMALLHQDRPQSVQEWLSLLGYDPSNLNDIQQGNHFHIDREIKVIIEQVQPVTLDKSGSKISVWQKGDTLYGNRYTIYRQLGGGGFGIVYLAKSREGKWVAIKTLNEIAQGRKDFNKVRENFQKEATMLGCCSHPNIVKIEITFSEGQLPCIVMEYVAGKNLSNYVDECGTLSEEEALHYIQQVGDALMEVHRKGLLHRDVKPENILIRDANKEAVLIDFGLVKEFLPDVTQQYTENMGTHGFSPGEMYDNKGRLGDYTDVYSLAATLYYLLTNEVPPAAFNRVHRDELVPPKQYNPNISDVVNSAILKGMAIDRRDRPQSVREWLNLLNGQGYKNWLNLPKIKPESKKLFLAGLIGWLGAIVSILLALLYIGETIFDLFQSPSNPVEQPADTSRE